MKKLCLYLTLLLSAFFYNAYSVPNTITYQGKFYDNGDRANGSYTMEFAIFDSETGGNLLWPQTGYETHTVQVQNGYYTVILGAGTTPKPISVSVFNTNDSWVEIKINSQVLAPRQKIHTVPYSFKAESLSINGNNEGDLLMWNGTQWVPVQFKLYYRDADGDGAGDRYNFVYYYKSINGFVDNNWDCDDTEPDGYNHNLNYYSEECLDLDCDGQPDDPNCKAFYRDYDNDGFFGKEPSYIGITAPSGYADVMGNDCDDENPQVNPSASEDCYDAIDNDCDGYIDMRDHDCSQLIEVCDGIDNNGNGEIDEGCMTFYEDSDRDGFGNPNVYEQRMFSGDNEGWALNDEDCDDSNPRINPTSSEICDDNIDNNCDGQVDENCETYYQDNDGDGYGNINTARQGYEEGYVLIGGDCDDSNPSIHPGAEEIEGDGIDNNCDGIIL